MSKIEKLPIPLLRVLAQGAALMPKQILQLRYRRWTGETINWAQPADLQQYILANVVSAREDAEKFALITQLADKVGVRDFVRERIGEEYLTRLYGTWERAEDIDWESLPEKFAIKTNNGCGTNIIVRNRAELNTDEAARKLNRWLKFPYGELTGQPQYSAIKPLILAEQLLEQQPGAETLPFDYKFFCFKGIPKFVLYYEGRSVNQHLTPNLAFDVQWRPLNDIVKRPATHEVAPPASLSEMVDLAAKLSKGFDFVRVDFYEINGRPLLGEMTFTPDVVTNFTPSFLVHALSYL